MLDACRLKINRKARRRKKPDIDYYGRSSLTNLEEYQNCREKVTLS